MKHPTLVVLAAGPSDGVADLKQQTPVGPDDERLHDYTVYDALSSGFGRVVFVVRPDNERQVREAFEDRFGPSVLVSYVRQFRPLGTGHAIASLGGVVPGPFALVNAGDFYGREAIRSIGDRLRQYETEGPGTTIRACIVNFRLGDTLSEAGGVSRAVCRLSADGRLLGLDEILDIRRSEAGEVVGRLPNGPETVLSLNDRVSMNLWGFDPGIVEALTDGYNHWTYELEVGQDDEYRLSSAVDALVKEGAVDVETVVGPDDAWLGLGHRGDVEQVRKAVAVAVERGDYPPSLKKAMRG